MLGWAASSAVSLLVAVLAWALGVLLAGAVYVATGWPKSNWQDGYPHTGGSTAVSAAVLGIGIAILVRRVLPERWTWGALALAVVAAAIGFAQGVDGLAF